MTLDAVFVILHDMLLCPRGINITHTNKRTTNMMIVPVVPPVLQQNCHYHWRLCSKRNNNNNNRYSNAFTTTSGVRILLQVALLLLVVLLLVTTSSSRQTSSSLSSSLSSSSTTVTAFTVPVLLEQQQQSTGRCLVIRPSKNFKNNNNNNDDDQVADTTTIDTVVDSKRRRNMAAPLLLAIITSSLTGQQQQQQPVNAIMGNNNKNQLFDTTNSILLTNPILEQLRIWEQAEADNIKYHGELERGDAGNAGKTNAYPSLLIPILAISHDITHLYHSLVPTTTTDAGTKMSPSSFSSSSSSAAIDYYPDAVRILSNTTYYETIAFKRFFNAYADNIYYNDPDRANLYLGGGATPKSIQSLAYLLRNEILDNLDNLRAEMQYQINNNTENNAGTDDDTEIRQFITGAYMAMRQYIELVVPPNELQRATELMKTRSTTASTILHEPTAT